MYTVYVIQNSDGILYKGYTSNLQKRILEHNSVRGKWTSARAPWNVVYKEEFASKSDALKREKFLKSGKGREFLKRVSKKILIG
ncbi:MAG: putative endonuclease containing a URI domain [Candidatus Peregrinibacteria bacterium Greene1014_49]|nr:MAG: putative endonuclease containing a URI domain [Candidatus Peregrinibacteria bacterium Greene1014_49]